MSVIDPKNELSFIFSAPRSQANNTGFFLADLEGNNLKGLVAFPVSIGTKTTGDNDGAITLTLSTSATNNISNAVAYTAAGNVATTNNALAHGVLSVNTRDSLRFVFLIPVITGTNSPAYPVAAGPAIGQSEVQPIQ